MSVALAIPFNTPGFPSGSWEWQPAIAEFVRVAFTRIQIRGPALTIDHLFDARFAANLILQEWSNGGVNLWAVGGEPDICIPLTGTAQWLIPKNTVNMLDCYRRIYTPSSVTYNIGNPLTPTVTQNGQPLVGQPWGDPQLIQPASGTLSCTAGSQYATLNWPAHGLIAGSPIFWGCPVSIGGIAVSVFSVVTRTLGPDAVQFMLPLPASETQNGQGATPLLTSTIGSSLIDVIWPGHNLSAGDLFPVSIETDVGGLTVSGNFAVVGVLNDYEFMIDSGAPISPNEPLLVGVSGQTIVGLGGPPLISSYGIGPPATFNDSQFINQGQLSVATQAPGQNWTDIFLWPISRDDYAFLPNKQINGFPTSFWFNRSIQPTITVWPVPAPPQAGDSQFVAFIGYRMRELMDANPSMGQTLEAPRRFYGAFVAALCAALAEIYKPEVHVGKMQLAELAWQKASIEDREKVSLVVVPDLSGFYG